jgi:glycosyltransferase involved in cell wall biosynthesis
VRSAAKSCAHGAQISVVVLGYRAGHALEGLVTALEQDLNETALDHEIVLVGNYDAGSDDPTPAVVERLAASRPHAKALTLVKQGGMGWDMRSGLDAAEGEVLVVIDGDGQYRTSDVVRLYTALRESGADLAKGRRTARGDGVYRRLLTTVYNLVFLALFPTRGLWDVNGKPKAITRDAYERVHLRTDDWFTDAELVLEARRLGLRIVDVPVAFAAGTGRPSFVRPRAILEFVAHLLRYRLTGRA